MQLLPLGRGNSVEKPSPGQTLEPAGAPCCWTHQQQSLVVNHSNVQISSKEKPLGNNDLSKALSREQPQTMGWEYRKDVERMPFIYKDFYILLPFLGLSPAYQVLKF